MAQRFRTKIVEIEATQFTGDNFTEMFEWSEGNFREINTIATEGPVRDDGEEVTVPVSFKRRAQVYDKLHTTWINVETGQWIVRGVKGEYYPCDDETFHWKYEEVVPDGEKIHTWKSGITLGFGGV